MFEKEAEEYTDKYDIMNADLSPKSPRHIVLDVFKAGAAFGYNKANKWHKVADGDLPPSLIHVLNEKGNKVMYDAQEHMWKEYSDYYEDYVEAEQPIAWCEVPTFKEV